MRARKLCRLLVVVLLFGWFLPPGASAQQVDPSVYSGMQWRLVGPFRGGRVLTVAGIPSQPNVYFFGSVGGGVWKTADGGVTWDPIFDSSPIGSIGAIAVAPSNPNVIYVGTGEADMRSDMSIGDGMFKSTDGGKTWTRIGLEDSRQISRILVDPSNPDLVLVAVLGHAYGPNDQRGVFRSADGGKSWQKVLYKDADTGAVDIAFDPANPRTVYATLWQTRRPPWSVYPPTDGPGSGLYRSTDEGETWTEMTATGLPPKPWGRVGIAVAPTGGGKILYALVSGAKNGVYRSTDAGATWQLVGTDPRVLGRQWYFGRIFVDPKNADVVYIANVSVYRSADGGKNWVAFKGAPGGDDYHDVWIDPGNPDRIIVGADQGATITVDGGRHWSSWYNQPTAQIYHVSTDNDFPYRVYGAQQDSGGMSILSRSDYGEITFHDWFPGWGGESGYILPDPNDPNTIYASTTSGGLERFDRRTGEGLNIAPFPYRGGLLSEIAAERYRFPWTPALALDPFNSQTIYFGSQVLFRSLDRGASWQVISPDLTGAVKNPPAKITTGPTTVEIARQRGYGVINTIAPSPVEHGLIWTGSDSGLVYLTRNGGQSWESVTPPGLGPWTRIAMIEPSHFDAGTAYLAVNRHRLDDYTPYIYRTHDFGKTWTRISTGIEAPAYVHAVREDPAHRGLLFAGTETGVYVSFDDGDHWQSLKLNLPVTPVRDLTIHQDDLVIATHGRSFWILDNITPLRQATAAAQASAAFLFQPQTATRMRPGSARGMPFPPELPAGQNPPDGAIVDYYLKTAPQGDVTLEILDSQGKLVRSYSSAGRPAVPKPTSLPFTYSWVKPPEGLAKTPGMHRFVWDIHYASLPGAPAGFGGFRRRSGGPWAVPGQYQVRLTVNGQAYTQPLTVRMDPRSPASQADLQKQFDLAMKIQTRSQEAAKALGEVRSLRTQLKDRHDQLAAGAGGAARNGARGAGGGRGRRRGRRRHQGGADLGGCARPQSRGNRNRFLRSDRRGEPPRRGPPPWPARRRGGKRRRGAHRQLPIPLRRRQPDTRQIAGAMDAVEVHRLAGAQSAALHRRNRGHRGDRVAATGTALRTPRELDHICVASPAIRTGRRNASGP
jgi:photosystem II stability/assembly factor-like uncharacterized protein